MKTFQLLALAGAVLSTPVPGYQQSILEVTEVPDYVRPYIVKAYTLDGLVVGPQIYRFPVTGDSSGGAFTLISTAAPGSTALGVLPHIHERHYENFFCLRGSFQLWAEKDDDEQARLLTPGDYGAVPQNTTHTFQTLSPVNEMVGVIVPGGFEALFYALATANYSSSIDAPFPAISNATSAGADASTISALEVFDVYAQLDYVPRRDLVNGTAPASDWHVSSNDLALNATTPFFVANGYGPQYITNVTGFWQIISPFITPVQSSGNFTEGKLTLSKQFQDGPAPAFNLTTHTAFEVTQGQLTVDLCGETHRLVVGDVVFIPAGTPFSYWSTVAYTTVLYVGGGSNTLDQQLLASATTWSYPIFPSEV